uniref:Uncharacterized protein LOC104248841 n=1 Tax=Nicotiana sylvestris TaxID=4096 RepID=A0A1U7YNA7_NICSY|nr:PREDICTED: uncharacterized protein LOC104248841 [Nicotiana sylvestris]
MDVLAFFDIEMEENAAVQDDVVCELGDDDFQFPFPIPSKIYRKSNSDHEPASMDLIGGIKCMPSKIYRKLNSDPEPASMDLIAEIKRILDCQKVLKEDFQMLGGGVRHQGMYGGCELDGYHGSEGRDKSAKARGINDSNHFENNGKMNEDPNVYFTGNHTCLLLA